MERVLERKRAETKGPSGSFSRAAESFGGLLVRGISAREEDDSVEGIAERVPSGLIRRVVCGGFRS